MSGWGGARLVAEREIRERVRERSFLIITIILLLASVAAVVIPAVVGDDRPDTTRIAVSGGPRDLPDALTAAAAAQGVRGLTVDVVADGAAAERSVRDDGADAAVIVAGARNPARVVVDQELPDDLRAVIQQGLGVSGLRSALGSAGIAPGDIDRLTQAPRVDLRVLSPDDSPPDGDVGVGILVAVILYVALLFAGTLVASGVAEEKTSRVSEVLLARLRPIDLLVGKVVGIGLLSIGQLAVAALPAIVAAVVVGAVDLPEATAETLAWGLVWFVAGYALYAAAYGALGALVGRQQEVGQVTAPLAMLLLAGYLGAAFGAAEPEGTLITTLSYLPPLAPMVMPVRIAAGAVGLGEIVVSLALTLAFGAALLGVGARVYRGGITRTGARIPLREALGFGATHRRAAP